MKMRLGSVLKFKAALAKKMGSCPICLHCVHCHNEMTNDTKSATTTTGATDSTSTNGSEDKESAVAESIENNQEHCVWKMQKKNLIFSFENKEFFFVIFKHLKKI